MENTFDDLINELGFINKKITELRKLAKTKSVNKNPHERSLIDIQIEAMKVCHFVLSERAAIALDRKHHSIPNRSRTVLDGS